MTVLAEWINMLTSVGGENKVPSMPQKLKGPRIHKIRRRLVSGVNQTPGELHTSGINPAESGSKVSTQQKILLPSATATGEPLVAVDEEVD